MITRETEEREIKCRRREGLVANGRELGRWKDRGREGKISGEIKGDARRS